jgi:hypothetical protein
MTEIETTVDDNGIDGPIGRVTVDVCAHGVFAESCGTCPGPVGGESCGDCGSGPGPMPGANQCSHGSMDRGCGLCELIRDLVELRQLGDDMASAADNLLSAPISDDAASVCLADAVSAYVKFTTGACNE